MITARPLDNADIPALERLLMAVPQHNIFHLSALAEFGLRDSSWAVGIFRDGTLVGAAMALRGTGGIYHTPDDQEALKSLADVVHDRVMNGRSALLSGHASQLDPLLPLVRSSIGGRLDRCDFCVLTPTASHRPPTTKHAQHSALSTQHLGVPRLATDEDMERLIDFYLHGFYSLARLPTREAWRNRLSEQLAFRSLFLIEDEDGRVVSAALSSAEGGGAAMLGGVATLDEYRGQGLSTMCVSALCGELFTVGTRSIGLFYLKDNTPAARVYAKLGFMPAGEWLLVPMGLGLVW